AAAANLQGTNLQPWQQEAILQNYLRDVPEFRELALFDADGRVLASSRLTGTTLAPLRGTPAGEIAFQPVDVDDDLLPRTQVTLRLRDEHVAYLVAELRLETIWRIVDEIRVGRTGYAALVDAEGRLIADGSPGGTSRVARGDRLNDHPLVATPSAGQAIYDGDRRQPTLAVVAPVPLVGWQLLIEQPTREAFAASRQLSTTLLVFVAFALAANVAIGIAFGRSLLRPIADLLRGIDAIGRGRLDERVR